MFPHSRRRRLGFRAEQATIGLSCRISGSLSFRHLNAPRGSDSRFFEAGSVPRSDAGYCRGKCGAERDCPKRQTRSYRASAATFWPARELSAHLRPRRNSRSGQRVPVGFRMAALAEEFDVSLEGSSLSRLRCLRAATSQGHPTVSPNCPQGAVFASVRCGTFGSLRRSLPVTRRLMPSGPLSVWVCKAGAFANRNSMECGRQRRGRDHPAPAL